MRAHYRALGGRLTIEIEGATIKSMFEAVAEVQEIFEAEDTCGNCGSTHIRFRVRVIEDPPGKYYELHCQECRADFSFGQLRDNQGLFPKRVHEESRSPLPNRGWRIYEPPEERRTKRR